MRPNRRELLRALALGLASAAFAPAIRRAAADAATSDRRPLPTKQPPRWIGHF
jgi:hypothetical protein